MYKIFLLLYIATLVPSSATYAASDGGYWSKLTSFWGNQEPQESQESEEFEDSTPTIMQNIMETLSKLPSSDALLKTPNKHLGIAVKELDGIGISGLAKLDLSTQVALFHALKNIESVDRFSEMIKILQDLQQFSAHHDVYAEKISHYINVLKVMHELGSESHYSVDSPFFTSNIVRLLEKMQGLEAFPHETTYKEQHTIVESLKKVKSFNDTSEFIINLKRLLKKKSLDKPNNQVTSVIDSWFEERDENDVQAFVNQIKAFVSTDSKNAQDRTIRDKDFKDSELPLELQNIFLSSCIGQEKTFKSCAQKVINSLCNDSRMKQYESGNVCVQAVKRFEDQFQKDNFDGIRDEEKVKNKLDQVRVDLKMQKINDREQQEKMQQNRNKQKKNMQQERNKVEQYIQSNPHAYREMMKDSTIPEGVQKALNQVALKYPKPVIQKSSFV